MADITGKVNLHGATFNGATLTGAKAGTWSEMTSLARSRSGSYSYDQITEPVYYMYSASVSGDGDVYIAKGTKGTLVLTYSVADGSSTGTRTLTNMVVVSQRVFQDQAAATGWEMNFESAGNTAVS